MLFLMEVAVDTTFCLLTSCIVCSRCGMCNCGNNVACDKTVMILQGSQSIQDYDQNSLSSFGSTTLTNSSCLESKFQSNNEIYEQDLRSPKDVCANVSVTNSSDIHIGDKNIYQGPVTIKQIVYANKNKNINACDNYGFVDDSTDLNNFNINNDGQTSEKKDCHVVENKKPKYYFLQQYARTKFLILLCLILFIVFIAAVIAWGFAGQSNPNLTSVLDKNDTDEQDETAPWKYHQDLTTSTQQKSKLRIFNRIDWLAQPPLNLTQLQYPVPYVIIHHTATENCSSHAQCILQVRKVQEFHIESRGWWDIGYNFLVGGDGAAYEGRGWTNEGAHTYGYNSKSIGIAFIGTFVSLKPKDIQIIVCQKLIDKGIEEGFISKKYKLLAARQLHSTESPGAALFEQMKLWKHWSSQP